MTITEGIGSQESKTQLNFAVEYGEIIVGIGQDLSIQYYMLVCCVFRIWLVKLLSGCLFGFVF